MLILWFDSLELKSKDVVLAYLYAHGGVDSLVSLFFPHSPPRIAKKKHITKAITLPPDKR